MPGLGLSAVDTAPHACAIRVDRACVRQLSRTDLTPAFVRRWKDLAQRSLTPNPFLEPEFVLPALKHLADLAEPIVLAVESDRGVLLGLGMFEEVAGSRRLPIPHLRAWQTPHTYLDGVLLDRRVPELAVSSLWKYLVEEPHAWHGVEFPRLQIGDPLDDILTLIGGPSGVHWSDGRTWTRALLRTDRSPEELERAISVKRAKSLRRGWHELERRGATEFRIDRLDAEAIASPVEEFLHLESLGWKTEAGTALDCCERQRAFFREMMCGFANGGRALFSSVTVGGSMVGTVAHLVGGAGAFAFKLGWDPAFERGCPGFQLKAKLAEHADELLPEIRWVDSCASQGSFIEHVWGDRIALRNRIFLTTRAAQVASTVVGTVRTLRDVLLGRGGAAHEDGRS